MSKMQIEFLRLQIQDLEFRLQQATIKATTAVSDSKVHHHSSVFVFIIGIKIQQLSEYRNNSSLFTRHPPVLLKKRGLIFRMLLNFINTSMRKRR